MIERDPWNLLDAIIILKEAGQTDVLEKLRRAWGIESIGFANQAMAAASEVKLMVNSQLAFSQRLAETESILREARALIKPPEPQQETWRDRPAML